MASTQVIRHARRALLVSVAVLLAGCGGGQGDERATVLATTTSLQDSGLLDELLIAYRRSSGRSLTPLAVGSGQAIALARRGEADVVLAHSPADERALMAGGDAGRRRLVMHNDFVLLGPPADPAGARGRTPGTALRRIARARARFVSRGDESGTHRLERRLWALAGVAPRGAWYEESGQGMGATLRIAEEKEAYVLADRATWLASGRPERLAILVADDPGLLNLYHVIDMTRRAGPWANASGGRAFADWLMGAEAQRIIGSFGRDRYGRPLFVADAGRTAAEVRAGPVPGTR
jgi:tungstate transport system substrate-binding protein